MSQGIRRKYDREFKVEAVKLVVDGGRSVAEAARNLGIDENLLHKWKNKYE
jgi:transposase